MHTVLQSRGKEQPGQPGGDPPGCVGSVQGSSAGIVSPKEGTAGALRGPLYYLRKM